jgi:DNA-binding TFAR19-related protein (PDSD5 family)
MCNPRRVTVTVTRDISEAWQREVSRTVALSEQVTGEARVRQPLSSSLGAPVLRALESRFVADNTGWQEVDTGYRYNVEGGYVLYNVDEQALEIVATRQDTVRSRATATTVLSGELLEKISTEQEESYYDDGYGGHTRTTAEQNAQRAAQQELDKMARARLEQVQTQAEAAESSTLQAQAQAEAQAQLAQAAHKKRAVLSEQAAQQLETVGLRCRQAFNRILAQAYRDSILAYARRNGAENISCQDGDDVLEIEFFME